MGGLDPDLFIKPHDQIRVGTHAIAPFLAAIRNSFRMTYGFGFVYDRNFADYDAFQQQANPKTLREAREASLFQTLFR
jgi:5-formyltetrahydrofolate cyclo-ligase